MLEGALLHDLLTIFVTEKLSVYMKFYEEKKDFIEGLGEFFFFNNSLLYKFLIYYVLQD